MRFFALEIPEQKFDKSIVASFEIMFSSKESISFFFLGNETLKIIYRRHLDLFIHQICQEANDTKPTGSQVNIH